MADTRSDIPIFNRDHTARVKLTFTPPSGAHVRRCSKCCALIVQFGSHENWDKFETKC